VLKGTCLCGQVSVETEAQPEHQPEACHCTMCRKQSGHVLAAVNIRRDALRIDGENFVTWYPSSDKVERGFCSVCGSTLFWKPAMEGYQYTAVAMGVFDCPTGLRLAKHTFVGDKGDYYEIADSVPRSEGY
jgi:hypothetical protein